MGIDITRTESLEPTVEELQQRNRTRRALLLGNNDYESKPLRASTHNARAIADKLYTLGFKRTNVTLLLNQTNTEMKVAISTFCKSLRDNDVKTKAVDLESDVLSPLDKAVKRNIVFVFLDCCQAGDTNDSFRARSMAGGVDRAATEGTASCKADVWDRPSSCQDDVVSGTNLSAVDWTS